MHKQLFISCILLLLLCCAYALNLHGIYKMDLPKYNIDASGKVFSCLDNSATLPIESLNNDFCDCTDGSDEPGTSACSHLSDHTQFFCNNLGHYAKHLKTGFVNDGVCDCCDGSDEYLGYINCTNTCSEKREESLAEFETKRTNLAKAMEKRDEYSIKGTRAIQQVKKDIDDKKAKIQKIKLKLKKLDKKQQAIEQKNIEKLQEEIKQIAALPVFSQKQTISFGNENEYYFLQGKTFDFNYTDFKGSYTYKFRPFVNVTQVDHKENKETLLGLFYGWAEKHAGMAFANGEACWQAPPRSARVVFKCALNETLTRVEEVSRCVYVLLFETPAACTTEHEKTLESEISRAKQIFERSE